MYPSAAQPLPEWVRDTVLMCGFVLAWVAWAYSLRSVFKARTAAYLSSLTFCVCTVVWASLRLALHVDYDAPGFPWHGPFTFGADNPYMLFAIAYFTTDSILDWDVRFLLHHIVASGGFITGYFFPTLSFGVTVTALIAEIGGISYHCSRLASGTRLQQPAYLVFLFTYGATRTIGFIPWCIYGWYWMLAAPTPEFWLKLWGTTASTIITYINLQWLRQQYRRYRKLQDGTYVTPESGAKDD